MQRYKKQMKEGKYNTDKLNTVELQQIIQHVLRSTFNVTAHANSH